MIIHAAASHLTAERSAEAALVAGVRVGDDAALERLFSTHYSAMCAVAFTLVRSRDAADDIVSTVFRGVWERRREWQPTSPVRDWLLRRTREEALVLLRRIERGHDRRRRGSAHARGRAAAERTALPHLQQRLSQG